MIWVRISAAPVAWISLTWVAFCGVWIALTPSVRHRAWAANIAAILAAVGLVEGALWLSAARNPYIVPPGVTLEGTFARPHYFIRMPSPGLGYQPNPGLSVVAIKRFYGHLIYQARYTVDQDGLRVAPPTVPQPDRCVLMFGDSFAWGEGVNDQDTAAYRLGVLAKGRLAVHNFAFTGYGAHQMLWLAQSGTVARKARCDPEKPVLAVFQTLPNNVGRVAGLRGWDVYGPRYRLGSDGQVSYDGGFDRAESILHDRVLIPAIVAAPLGRIQLYGRILGRDRRPDAFDIERFSTVVRTARDQLRATYPRLRFVVVVWPDPDEAASTARFTTAAFLKSLRQHDLEVWSSRDLMPDYDRVAGSNFIPGDGHLTAAAHLRLAASLLRLSSVDRATP